MNNDNLASDVPENLGRKKQAARDEPPRSQDLATAGQFPYTPCSSDIEHTSLTSWL